MQIFSESGLKLVFLALAHQHVIFRKVINVVGDSGLLDGQKRLVFLI